MPRHQAQPNLKKTDTDGVETMSIDEDAATSDAVEERNYAMPIGIDNFKELVNTNEDGIRFWFADKSQFIKGFTGPKTAKVSLITRPRRFGKTLNLSMLEYFFNIINAEENRKLFDGLAISKDKTAMKHQGKYPVISISLKSIGASNLEALLARFKAYMKKLYHRYYYLLNVETGKLTPEEQTDFKNVCSGMVSPAELEASFEQLIRFVEKHHGEKVMVLVDEYDSPLLSAFHGGFEEEFREFYRNFLGQALKDNKAIFKSVITGIVQIAGAGLFSEFNNPDTFNIIDEPHSTSFGFTEKDISVLLTDVGANHKRDELISWYNGYQFGEEGHTIYNPWSVLKYIARKFRAKSYWAYTSDNALLRKELLGADEFTKAELAKLMEPDGKLIVSLNSDLRFAEVGVGREESLWTLLLSAGYLKTRFLGMIEGLAKLELSIPNKEIIFIYHQIFKSWLTEKMAETKQNSKSLLNLLKTGQIEKFCQALEQFFLASVSLHDVRRDNIETFYHGFVLALLGLMNTSHIGILRSNQEMGLGRSDIVFQPRDVENDIGIVIELKRLGESNTKGKEKSAIKKLLQKSTEEGFEQISDRAYSTDLIDRGVKQIAWISLAFSGKQMAYRYREPVPVEMLDDDAVSEPNSSKRRRLEKPKSSSAATATKAETRTAATSPRFFSQRSRVIDTHWYNDDEMNNLLKLYLGDVNGVVVMAGIRLEQHAGGTLAQNLQQLETELAQLEVFAQVVTPTIVVPINLGNQHWTALYIHHHDKTGDRTRPTIGYFDPIGELMPRLLKGLLNKRYSNSRQQDFLESAIRLQKDGYNCGPWVVEILTGLIQNGRLPPEDFDITAARARHQSILAESVARATQGGVANKIRIKNLS